MQIALYARVSTSEQSSAMQLDALRKYAGARGWNIHAEYVDEGFSGAKMNRPGLERLLNDVRKGRVDGVAVWKFDRFARSTNELIKHMLEFRSRKIIFCSYTENLDTSTPMGEAMFTILAAFAQFERDLIRERVKEGVKRAMAKPGVTWGRPCKVFTDPGGSIRHAVEVTGVNRETIRRHRLKNGYRYVQVEVPDVTPPEQP